MHTTFVHAGYRDLKLCAVLLAQVQVDKLYKCKSKCPHGAKLLFVYKQS